MFSPRIYWRLFESNNREAWPAQPLLLLAGLGWLSLVWRQTAGVRTCRGAAVVLSLCWLFVAWAFLWQRFAPIQWVASAYAVAFAAQGVGLSILATRLDTHATLTISPTWRRRVGMGLALWALLMHPLLALVDGRPWQQAEVFGLAPDPTAIGSLAVLLLMASDDPRTQTLLRLLWLLPLAWCAVSAATLATMGSWQAAVPLMAAALAVAAAWAGRR